MTLGVANSARRWLRRHPLLKAVVKTISAPVRGGVSRAYTRLGEVEKGQASVALRGAWQTETIPALQRRVVDAQLADYRAGAGNRAFDTLVEFVQMLVDRAHLPDPSTVLEVGCSSGYHSEVFRIKHIGIQYTGCDYSPAFIRMAREVYPTIPFTVADATALPMPSDSFDIVISGCCLLHIANFEEAIKESARVSSRYVLFHRTPVLHMSPTTFFRKLAYGIQTIEIHFNEEELLSLFTKHGLSVIAISTLDISWKAGDAYATKEYICEKSVPADARDADGR